MQLLRKGLSSKEDSGSSTATPLLAVMNPLLLSAACSGSWQDLEFLHNRQNGQPHLSINSSKENLDMFTAYSSRSCSNKGASMQKPSNDVKALLNMSLVSVVSLLDGVTIEGGTALHVRWQHMVRVMAS